MGHSSWEPFVARENLDLKGYITTPTPTKAVDASTDSALAQSVAKFIQVQTDMLAAQTKAMAAQNLPILVVKEVLWGMRAMEKSTF